MRTYLENGKFEQVFGVAGHQAGGTIANVDSLEELDKIITEFPLGPFAQTEVYPLMDLFEALADRKKNMQKRLEQMGGKG